MSKDFTDADIGKHFIALLHLDATDVTSIGTKLVRFAQTFGMPVDSKVKNNVGIRLTTSKEQGDE